MAKKKWRLKVRQASTDVPVVKFSHGSLKSGHRLRTDVYEHKETIAGRVRTRRILVSESDCVQYVGENFGEHSVRANALCKHFIGVEDVSSGKVRLYPANLITMRPYFAPASTKTSTADTTTTTYREKADALATAFGSKRKRQAVESRQRLNVDESTLHSTATSTLAEIKVAASEQLAKTSSHTPATTADSILESIPPQNKDATIPQEVYRLEDIIPPAQNGYLDELAEPFLTADADDIAKWRSEAEYPEYVLQRLGRLSRDPLNRVLEARMLIYYHMLIQVSRLKYTDLKRKDPLPNIDAPLKHILLDTFTLTSKNEKGMTSRTFPQRMKDKVLAYILVLVLILEDYKFDFGLVQPDTKAANMRMTTLSYALGCHVGSHKLPGSHVTTKFLELKLPLVDPSQQHKNKRART
ncbi:unnamed protein product [Ixodes persulcatus]